MYKKVGSWFLVFHLVAVTVLIQPASASQSGNVSESAIPRARTLIHELRKVGDIPGIAVAVGTGSGILWEEGFGFSDLENNVRVTPNTRFRLGSVSKIVTMAAAMRLVERGLLNLDAPVATYLPSLPEPYGKVTVRQLAGHQAGVRHYKPSDFQFDLKHSNSVKDSIKIFTGDPLAHEPGTKYLYSTFGYVLISAALEGASKKDFLSIVQEEVYAPLKLNSSGPDMVKAIIPNKTRYYERSEGSVVNAPHEDPSYKWAAGGMLSSAGDLVRFGAAHLSPGYLKKETLDEMFRIQRTSAGAETIVGLGWRVGSDWNGRKIYHHAGNISGGRAVLIVYPENDLVIALLSNASGQPAFVESTAQLIAENFLAQDPAALQLTTTDLSGSYELTGVNGEKRYSAKLELKRNSGDYRGSITGEFPILEAAAKNGLPVNHSIISVWAKEKNPALILVSPFGIVEILLQKSDTGGFRFSVDEGPAKFEGEMKKIQ